jgi:hypothetical protein
LHLDAARREKNLPNEKIFLLTSLSAVDSSKVKRSECVGGRAHQLLE